MDRPVDRQVSTHLLDVDVACGVDVELARRRQRNAQRVAAVRAIAPHHAVGYQRQVAEAADGSVAIGVGVGDVAAGLDEHVARGAYVVYRQIARRLQGDAAVGLRDQLAGDLHVHVVLQLQGHALHLELVQHHLAACQCAGAGVVGRAQAGDLGPKSRVGIVLARQVQRTTRTQVPVKPVAVVEFDQHQAVVGNRLVDRCSLAGAGGEVGYFLPLGRIAEVLAIQVGAIGGATGSDVSVGAVLAAIDIARIRSGEHVLLGNAEPRKACAQRDHLRRLAAPDRAGAIDGNQRDIGADHVRHLGRRLDRAQAQEFGMRIKVAVQARRDRVLEGSG